MTVSEGDYIFIDNAPNYAADKELFLGRSRKLQPAMTGPFEILSANEVKVNIRMDRIPITVSIDISTKAPRTQTTEETQDNIRKKNALPRNVDDEEEILPEILQKIEEQKTERKPVRPLGINFQLGNNPRVN